MEIAILEASSLSLRHRLPTSAHKISRAHLLINHFDRTTGKCEKAQAQIHTCVMLIHAVHYCPAKSLRFQVFWKHLEFGPSLRRSGSRWGGTRACKVGISFEDMQDLHRLAQNVEDFWRITPTQLRSETCDVMLYHVFLLRCWLVAAILWNHIESGKSSTREHGLVSKHQREPNGICTATCFRIQNFGKGFIFWYILYHRID